MCPTPFPSRYTLPLSSLNISIARKGTAKNGTLKSEERVITKVFVFYPLYVLPGLLWSDVRGCKMAGDQDQAGDTRGITYQHPSFYNIV